MGKSLLLISTRPEDQAFAVETASEAGLTLLTTRDPVEGGHIIMQDEPQVIIADVSTQETYLQFEAAIQESVGLFSDKINANAIHFVSSDELEKVRYLIESPLFGHFILRDSRDPKAAGRHYGTIVQATLAERAFGLSRLLKGAPKVQIARLQKSTQKQEAVEAVRNYLLAAKFQTRMATVIANAVDEILMNAIFDAPVDEAGRTIFGSTPRNTPLELSGRQSVEMHVAFNGEFVAITAVDLFGSLDKIKLLTHISKIYREEEYKIRTATAGAGIGLATVFRTGGSLFFSSESRHRTEVTVFYKRTENFRDFKEQFRFISTQFYF